MDPLDFSGLVFKFLLWIVIFINACLTSYKNLFVILNCGLH